MRMMWLIDCNEALNVAVTDWLDDIVTLHAPVPVQAPDQPVKAKPASGVAVNATVDPEGKLALQVEPQLIPAGLLVTVPVPIPFLVTVSCVEMSNSATTEAASLSVRVHAPVPVHAPDQPKKMFPALGVAVSVTTVPPLKVAVHDEPQLMPVGLLVTVPVPVPVFVTVNCTVAGLKVAVTDSALLTTTVHAPLPVHAPDQPTNTLPEPGVAVRVTDVPESNCALHVDPQLIPDGLLLTEPVPPPLSTTERAKWPCNVKVAVTDCALLTVTVQEPVPEHAPDQPEKVLPEAGVAESVTTVPLSKFAVQVWPQLMPAGELVTVPVPLPASATFSCD